MESKAKLLGHPIHPMLVVFPLGLLGTSLVFDGLSAVKRRREWGQTAYWMIGAGLLGGAAAAVFGAADFGAIPKETRARRIGLWHGLGNAVVLALFGASYLRRRADPGRPSRSAVALSTAGGVLALVTGWLGGELVDRLGVGVDDEAHLDAPSSLARRKSEEIVYRA